MIKNINHGFTMDYFVPGVFTIIIGCPFFAPGISIGWKVLFFLILVFGLALLLIQTGIAIDSRKRRIRKLHKVFGFRYGRWHEISPKDKIKLDYTNQTAELTGPVTNTNVQAKTFDLLLISSNKETEIYEFRKYSNAKYCILLLNEMLQIEVQNRFA